MTPILVSGDLPTEVASSLLESEIIAVDTETSGLDWRVEDLQLCQLYSPTCGPVLLRDVTGFPSQLARVFASPGTLKVFHFAPFDIRFIESKWKTPLNRIACTKAASKILRPDLPGKSHSLDVLLEREMGVQISKGPVRTSNWGATDLSDEQIKYAAADVEHLVELYQHLVARLTVRNFGDVYRAVCDYMLTDARFELSGVPNLLTY